MHGSANSGAIFFGEADADAFTYNDGVTYLAACGCPAETGCQCHQKITSLDTPAMTPLAVVRTGIEKVRREMAAEREAAATLRRIRNEDARVFKYLRQVPVTNGYSEALARQHGSEPELDIYQHGPLPCPYTLALGEIVQRRADGTPVRLPEGDDPPDGYALALEARRQADRLGNDN